MGGGDLVKSISVQGDEEIREWLEGNIGGCAGYHNIVKAIQAASAEMRS